MNDLNSNTESRGWFLTVMAVLFVVLAFSDFTKALQYHGDPANGGLVVLGHKIQGVGALAIAGPIFGAILLAYAFGIWRLKQWVIPLSIVYAFFVPVNMVMFWSLHQLTPPTVRFIVMYLAVSLTGSVGTALYIAYHRNRFQS